MSIQLRRAISQIPPEPCRAFTTFGAAFVAEKFAKFIVFARDASVYVMRGSSGSLPPAERAYLRRRVTRVRTDLKRFQSGRMKGSS